MSKDSAPKVVADTALEAYDIVVAMRPDREPPAVDGRMLDRDDLIRTLGTLQRNNVWNKQ